MFLLPSLWEGMPLALLDAMAFGAVPIATDVGAVGEIIEHDVSGFLIDPLFPEAEIVDTATRHVLAVLESPDGMEDIRHAACRRALSWSWSDAARILDQAAMEALA